MENKGYVGDIEISTRGPSSDAKLEITHTYEEAVLLTGTGKFHYILLLICGFGIMAFQIEILGVSLIIPLAKCDLNITLAQQALLASAGFFGTVLSSHMWGFLADTWGRLKVLRVAISSAVILAVISAFSISPWMLIIFRFLVGISVAGSMASAFTYIGEFHGIKKRRRVISYLSAFLPIGVIYTPALAIGILPLEINAHIFGMQLSSWRLFLAAASIPGVLCVITLQFLPKSPRYLLIQGDHDGALEILKKIFTMNTNKTSDQYPVKNINLDTVGKNLSGVHNIKEGLLLIWSQTVPIFYKSRIWSTLNFSFQMFLMFFTAHGVFMWAPSIVAAGVQNIDKNMTICGTLREPFNEKGNSTLGVVLCSSHADVFMYKIMLVMGILFSIFYVLVGVLITPVGPKRLLFSWMLLAGLCGLGIYWSKTFYLSIALFILFLSVGNMGGAISSLAVEYYPSNINGMAVCFILMAGRVGSAFGSNLIGTFLVDHCETIFTSLGIIIIIAGCIASFLPAKSLKKKMIKTIN